MIPIQKYMQENESENSIQLKVYQKPASLHPVQQIIQPFLHFNSADEANEQFIVDWQLTVPDDVRG